ncbi:hypothetical protein AB833_24525 [Chromatiales bacterium (ex Bugula neritina AB1)]|nr:hypothetical protein AB833_24525 [Chromatiales bacterium (ex Bugula neritina AB1)]
MVELETRGIPSVGIATTEFIEAAAAQSESLAYDPALIFVPHPIQDRTDEELRQIADNAFDRIVEKLVAGNRDE